MIKKGGTVDVILCSSGVVIVRKCADRKRRVAHSLLLNQSENSSIKAFSHVKLQIFYVIVQWEF